MKCKKNVKKMENVKSDQNPKINDREAKPAIWEEVGVDYFSLDRLINLSF